MVDTFWDLAAHAGVDGAVRARLAGAGAARGFNTHHNGDHCWGNSFFAGAEIIGHRLGAASFGKEQPKLMQSLKEQVHSDDPALAALARELESYDFTGIELTPPTTVFDDRLDLELDGLRVELLYVGPAHTAGDTIVHLPAQRVVFTGDVLFRLCTPIGWEGTFATWAAALDRIIALDPAVIVPGHGPLCGLEGPRELKAYLQYVRGEAERFFHAGVSMEEAARRIDLGPYAEPQRILFNVARAYRELRGEPQWTRPSTSAACCADVCAARRAGLRRGGAAMPRRWRLRSAALQIVAMAPLSVYWFLYFAGLGVFFLLPLSAVPARECRLSGTEVGAILAVLPLVGLAAQPLLGTARRPQRRAQRHPRRADARHRRRPRAARPACKVSLNLLGTAALAAVQWRPRSSPVSLSADLRRAARRAGPHRLGLVRVGTVGYGSPSPPSLGAAPARPNRRRRRRARLAAMFLVTAACTPPRR
ncbi:MAG: MBL fold metallo-hydrolase [Candidatus Binatia bacterium]